MSWDILPKAKLQYLLTRLKEVFDKKVDKETGKGLSTNDYTTTEKNKLSGIASGAEVNVQSDWNQTTTTADDFIKNKPTIPTNNNQLTNGAGYITSSGTAKNVSGTVAIGNGGTGATTRLNALKNLTNENVSTAAKYFLTITDSWGKGGYTSLADAKTALGLNANVSRVQISSYLSSDYTLYPPSSTQWSDYFYTTASVNIKGTYLVMVSAWMKDNTGGSPKFRALINGVATAEYICSGSGLIGFTYFGIVTISTQGTLVARLQGTSNNASSCKVPAYFTHQLVLTKIDGTF